MKQVIILKGLPASGKTTWAKQQLKDHPGKYKRVNKDDLRSMLDGGKWSRDNEKFVLLARNIFITMALEEGKHVIVDDTNLHPKHEKAIREALKKWNEIEETKYSIEIKEFPIDPNEAIKRDLQRPNSVGSKVIMDMYNRYLKPKPETYTPPQGKPKAIIVDIDGTVALMNGKRGPYEWDKVAGDDVNGSIYRLLEMVVMDRIRSRELGQEPVQIIMVSGRDGSCYEETKNWLDGHEINHDQLFLRPAGDTRKDYVIKKEIFNTHIRDHYDVQFVLDDRNQTVEMWRSLGLTCLQVADGNF
jgi:predicted kinase